ncbi:MAG: hypothetical protein ACK5AZ_16015 [Bryobacteraceae bacterium]
MKDLLILTADKNTQFAIEGLLSRPAALGIGTIQSWEILVHARRDPAVFRGSHEFLRPHLRRARYALVVFDREGCGGDKRSREELEGIVQSRLDSNGWHGRASVVAIDPELEAWVWSNSPEVDAALGWGNRNPQLRRIFLPPLSKLVASKHLIP